MGTGGQGCEDNMGTQEVGDPSEEGGYGDPRKDMGALGQHGDSGDMGTGEGCEDDIGTKEDGDPREEGGVWGPQEGHGDPGTTWGPQEDGDSQGGYELCGATRGLAEGCPEVVTPQRWCQRPPPGLASTVAMWELAQLWHSLSPDERCPYWYILVHTGCPDAWVSPPDTWDFPPRTLGSPTASPVPRTLWAWQFSRLHNR